MAVLPSTVLYKYYSALVVLGVSSPRTKTKIIILKIILVFVRGPEGEMVDLEVLSVGFK